MLNAVFIVTQDVRKQFFFSVPTISHFSISIWVSVSDMGSSDGSWMSYQKPCSWRHICGEKWPNNNFGDIHCKTLFFRCSCSNPISHGSPNLLLLKTLFSWIYVSITSKTERVVTSFKSNLQNEKKYIFKGKKEKKDIIVLFNFLQVFRKLRKIWWLNRELQRGYEDLLYLGF